MDRRFWCVPALSYEELHWVLGHSQAVLTDSGGLQEEATWYPIPSLILRNSTDRPEAITAQCGTLVGTDPNEVTVKLQTLLQILVTKKNHNKLMSQCSFPFGHGNASEKILDILLSHENVSLSDAAKRIPYQSLPSTNKKVNTKFSLKNKSKITQNTDVDFITKIFNSTIGVVLQVYKRNTLEFQLDSILSQTLVPRTVIVLQNGFHVNISQIILNFRKRHPHIELQHIASSKNLRFHGRFHMAYMMQEDWVSIWDDDVQPKSQWLQYSIEYSKKNGNALVGANGRTFVNIDAEKCKVKERWDQVGENDFVGHIWTLPRVFLKYLLEMKLITEHTGEDVQLSFALQKHGIRSVWPQMGQEKSAHDMPSFFYDQNAASRLDQAPRQVLFFQLLRYGFKTLKCSNCHNSDVIHKCINFLQATAKKVTKLAKIDDAVHNRNISWHV